MELNATKQIIRNHVQYIHVTMHRMQETRNRKILTRLRIDHSNLTHGHYMSKEQRPTCED